MPPRSRAALGRLFASSPFSVDQGLRLRMAAGGKSRVAVRLRRGGTQGLGVAHGGILTALADTAATFAAYSAVDAGEQLLTTGLSMSFLDAAHAGEGIEAVASLLRRGRRLVVAEVAVRGPDGRAVAAGHFTMLRLPADGATAGGVRRAGARSPRPRGAR